MTSAINISAINTATPVVGTRYSASDERGSRVAIKNGLQTAATEITELQNEVANISSSGNFTGIVNFTDGGGFTGNVTNNSLSLTLQNANATQNGQLTSTKFVEIGNATSDISTLQTALGNKQDTLVSTTNIKTINGVSILGSGDMTITGDGNISGITGFTDGGGFTGTVTNNSLSLALQYANATQDGQITFGKFTDWENKGSSNLTVGNTTGTAFDGALGAGAVSNVTTLQGNVTNLTIDVNALNSAMRYIGGWDASTGAFPASTQAGYVYSVTVDGIVDGIDFVATDRLLSILDNASTATYAGNWIKEDYTDKVISVNGQVGTVSLTTANITASTDKNYVTDSMLSKINQTAANSNVTYVQGNGTVNGIELIGNVTSGGNLTLSGNLTGTAPNLTAGNAINIPNLTGTITGNATGYTVLTPNGFSSANLSSALTNKTGIGLNVFDTNCTLNTPNLTTPSFCNLSNAIGLNLTTGVSGILPTVNGGADQSAWVSFTPSWTNFTIGNGSQSAKYNYDQIRKVVFVRVFVTLGSTSSMGTAPSITFPVTSAATPSSQFEISVAGRLKTSSTRYELAVWWSSTAGAQLLSVLSGVPTTITATSPHTWATGDTLSITMMYEAA